MGTITMQNSKTEKHEWQLIMMDSQTWKFANEKTPTGAPKPKKGNNTRKHNNGNTENRKSKNGESTLKIRNGRIENGKRIKQNKDGRTRMDQTQQRKLKNGKSKMGNRKMENRKRKHQKSNNENGNSKNEKKTKVQHKPGTWGHGS